MTTEYSAPQKYGALKTIGACGFVGALYGGLACAMLANALAVMEVIQRGLGKPIGSSSDIFLYLILGSMVGAVAGSVMGYIGALLRSWTFGGFIAGLIIDYFTAGSIVFLPTLILFAVGIAFDWKLRGHESRLPFLTWLIRIVDNSTLRQIGHAKRTWWGLIFPCLLALAGYGFHAAPYVWPIYQSNRHYTARIGWWTVVRRSYELGMPRRRYPFRASCQSNLRSVSLALKQYGQDYDDKLPPVKSGGATFGWADAIQPYAKSTRILQCPYDFLPGQPNPRAKEYSDYWFNSNLSGVSENKLNSSALIITLGEGNDGADATDARYNYPTVPPAWITDSTSPAQRHIGGGNYAFVDGHVKWFKPNNLVNNKSVPYAPMFLPQ